MVSVMTTSLVLKLTSCNFIGREYEEGEEVEVTQGLYSDEFAPNSDSLMEELHFAVSGKNLPGNYQSLPLSFLSLPPSLSHSY